MSKAALNVYHTTVALQHMLHNGQTQARAAGLA